jgi:hypothetical protein
MSNKRPGKAAVITGAGKGLGPQTARGPGNPGHCRCVFFGI